MTGGDLRNVSTTLQMAKVLENIIFDRKSKKKHKLLAIELHLKCMDAARTEMDRHKNEHAS